MTSKERVMAVIAGKEPDRKPTLAWPGDQSGADVLINRPGESFEASGQLRLTRIANPLGRAIAGGHDLVAALRSDLKIGEGFLEKAAALVQQDIQTALTNSDGIAYVLFGADMRSTTPMEYGGHFLEVDRTLLSSCEGAIRMVFIVGGEDAFVDVVSDLPGEIFAWDIQGTGVSVADVRTMRKGALAATSSDADIVLTHPGDISPKLTLGELTNV